MKQKQSEGRNEKAGQVADYTKVAVDLAALANVEDRERFDAEWDRFFKGYHSRLMQFFSYWVRDDDDREDLVQNIFVRAYRAIAVSGQALRSEDAAWSWLTTIGKNLLRDDHAKSKTAAKTMDGYAREMAIETELQAAENVLEALVADGDAADGWNVGKATFEERLSQLSDEDRRLLHMRFVESLEWSEIAKRERRKSDAVRKQYSRLRAFLRDGS